MTKKYEIISTISNVEAEDLAEFLGSRSDSDTLITMVQEKSKLVQNLYRGINFRKKDLYIGQIYRHWNTLSSWSKNKDIAVKFALDDYIPEGLLEEIAVELGYEANQYDEPPVNDEICKEIIKVVFVLQAGYGFYVNEFINHEIFSKEEEVICYEGEWEITNIVEKNKDGKIYYEAQVKIVSEQSQSLSA